MSTPPKNCIRKSVIVSLDPSPNENMSFEPPSDRMNSNTLKHLMSETALPLQEPPLIAQKQLL